MILKNYTLTLLFPIPVGKFQETLVKVYIYLNLDILIGVRKPYVHSSEHGPIVRIIVKTKITIL